jgi:HK97 family phage major capsid protein/HK97 family phage prohead protease
MTDFIETKAAFTVDDAGAITGVAWPFGSADRVGDVITKGAFASTPARLPMLWSHDQSAVIGVWDSIDETSAGLQVKGRLLIDSVEKAREVRALVTAGAVNGLSIGFKTKQSTPRPRGGRTISALDLVEISVVAVPSHPDARILSAKSATHTKGKTMENDNIEDIETKTVDVTEIEEKFTSLETKLASFDALGSRLDKIEARLNRPGAPAIIAHKGSNGEVETKAFLDYVRAGEIDRKALSVASNGGVLVPEVLLNEIQRVLIQVSPIRSIARVTSVGVPIVSLPKETSAPTAAWVGEATASTESSSVYGTPQDIKAHNLRAHTDASLNVLEDSQFDLQSEIVNGIAKAFAKKEGAAFVNGTGDANNQPTGFLTSPAAGSIVDATPLGGAMPTADDFMTAFYELPSEYAANAVWILNRSIMGAIRKMKAESGDYIWSSSDSRASLAFPHAGTILGAPVVEVPDMPNLGAETVVAIVGDFQEAYRIIDRVGLDVVRDDFTQRTVNNVRFHARKRVGGDVVNANALRFLKTTAA